MKKLFRIRMPVLAILLILLLVVILPMYLLGYGIYQWGYRMTTDEIAQSTHARVSFVIATLEAELQRIREVHQEFLNDSDLFYYVNALSAMNPYERLSELLAIEKRLALVHDSSAYIEEATLWMPRLSRMVSSSRGVDPATDDWQAIMGAPVISLMAGLSVYDGGLCFCAAYPPGIWRPDYVPQYVLAIRISNERIMEDLMSFNLNPDSGTLLQSKDQAFWLQTGRDIGLTGNESDSLPARALSADGREAFLLASADSDFLNLQMRAYVSERIIYSGLDAYRKLFTVFTAAAFMLIVAFIWFSRRLVSEPVRRLVDSLRQAESGKLDVRIDYKANDEFGYLYTAFNQMAESLANMLEINARQLALAQEAELRQLQAQINPHFLHNSFFILYRMAKDEDYENIGEFLICLSEYYRYVTRNASMVADLSDEDGHARRYAQIQLVRFGKRISAEFAPLPEGLGGVKVPRLILQPLLENAFQHGFKDTISGGLLRVWYEEERGGKVYIHVEDNGSGIAGERMSELQSRLRDASNANIERSGLVNIHQRLRMRFGPDCGLKVESLLGRVSRFTLVLSNANPQLNITMKAD
ncbi:MAG: histidine kinase [Clostridiales bacterium]|nr:histidine kinase [Clostridiales bacterium]